MQNLRRNFIYNGLYQVLLIVTPLLTAPYLSRVLGADGIGIQSFSASIVSYFVLIATMGVSTFGRREISYVRDSIYQRSVVFWNTKIFGIIVASVTLLIYLLFALRQDNSVIYLIFALNIVSVALDTTWYFQGMEEFGLVTGLNALAKILDIVFVFIFVKTKEDLSIHVFGTVFFPLLTNIVLCCIVPSSVIRVPFSELKPFSKTRSIISLFIPTIAIQIYEVLDKTMIGLVGRNAFESGYYEQAVKISKMSLCVITGASVAIMPRIAYLWEKNQKQEVRLLMGKTYRVLWLVGLPLMIGIITVAPNFVPWFFGEEYLKVIPLLKILAILFIPIGINNIIENQYLIPTGRQRFLTISVCCGIFTNIIVSYFLIKKWLSLGAAVGSVISEFVVAIIQIVVLNKELSLKDLFGNSQKYAFASSIMGLILYFESTLLDSSVVNTLIMFITGVLIYFSCLVFFRDELFIEILDNISKRFVK